MRSNFLFDELVHLIYLSCRFANRSRPQPIFNLVFLPSKSALHNIRRPQLTRFALKNIPDALRHSDFIHDYVTLDWTGYEPSQQFLGDIYQWTSSFFLVTGFQNRSACVLRLLPRYHAKLGLEGGFVLVRLGRAGGFDEAVVLARLVFKPLALIHCL